MHITKHKLQNTHYWKYTSTRTKPEMYCNDTLQTSKESQFIGNLGNSTEAKM